MDSEPKSSLEDPSMLGISMLFDMNPELVVEAVEQMYTKLGKYTNKDIEITEDLVYNEYLILEDGFYTGYIKRKKPYAFGSLLISTGQIYEGAFRRGKIKGMGRMIDLDGTAYEGYWKNSDIKDQGKIIWLDGRVYTGKIKKIRPHGPGVMAFPDSSRYEGNFKKSLYSGLGTFFYNDGKIYAGQWKSSKMHGFGAMHWPDKFYIGYFTHNNITGIGKMEYINSDIYIGQWVDGKKHGLGCLYSTDIKKGEWADDHFKGSLETLGEFEPDQINSEIDQKIDKSFNDDEKIKEYFYVKLFDAKNSCGLPQEADLARNEIHSEKHKADQEISLEISLDELNVDEGVNKEFDIGHEPVDKEYDPVNQPQENIDYESNRLENIDTPKQQDNKSIQIKKDDESMSGSDFDLPGVIEIPNEMKDFDSSNLDMPFSTSLRSKSNLTRSRNSMVSEKSIKKSGTDIHIIKVNPHEASIDDTFKNDSVQYGNRHAELFTIEAKKSELSDVDKSFDRFSAQIFPGKNKKLIILPENPGTHNKSNPNILNGSLSYYNSNAPIVLNSHLDDKSSSISIPSGFEDISSEYIKTSELESDNTKKNPEAIEKQENILKNSSGAIVSQNKILNRKLEADRCSIQNSFEIPEPDSIRFIDSKENSKRNSQKSEINVSDRESIENNLEDPRSNSVHSIKKNSRSNSQETESEVLINLPKLKTPISSQASKRSESIPENSFKSKAAINYSDTEDDGNLTKIPYLNVYSSKTTINDDPLSDFDPFDSRSNTHRFSERYSNLNESTYEKISPKPTQIEEEYQKKPDIDINNLIKSKETLSRDYKPNPSGRLEKVLVVGKPTKDTQLFAKIEKYRMLELLPMFNLQSPEVRYPISLDYCRSISASEVWDLLDTFDLPSGSDEELLVKREAIGNFNYDDSDYAEGIELLFVDWVKEDEIYYMGQVDSNGERSGKGIELLDDSIYEGYWKKNQRSGLGRVITKDGKSYEGYWTNDIKRGFGALYTDKGNAYIGDWDFDSPQGKGVEISNKETYEGDFHLGLRHGKGVLNQINLSYTGEFYEGQAHGYGVVKWPNGSAYAGIFINGESKGIKGVLISSNQEISLSSIQRPHKNKTPKETIQPPPSIAPQSIENTFSSKYSNLSPEPIEEEDKESSKDSIKSGIKENYAKLEEENKSKQKKNTSKIIIDSGNIKTPPPAKAVKGILRPQDGPKKNKDISFDEKIVIPNEDELQKKKAKFKSANKEKGIEHALKKADKK